jgi:hypothetical protein
MDEATQQAIVKTFQKAAEAHGELVKAVQRLEAQIKELQARVEALERLRTPRAVPSP